MPDINYFSLATAVIVGFLVSVLWYGPIFGTIWKRVKALSEEKFEKLVSTKVFEHTLLHLVGLIVSAFALSYFVERSGVDSFAEGVWVGFLFWTFGTILLVLTGALHKELENENIYITIIDIMHWLVVFVLMAGILSVF